MRGYIPAGAAVKEGVETCPFFRGIGFLVGVVIGPKRVSTNNIKQ
jgi:hypothetical protein